MKGFFVRRVDWGGGWMGGQGREGGYRYLYLGRVLQSPYFERLRFLCLTVED